MPSYQEQFTAFFNVFWEEIQKNVVDLHRSLELVSICRTKALDVENDDSVTASEYWFCGFIACFCHLLDNGMSVVVLNDGKEMIDHALSLLPEDKEYRLYHIIYSIFEIDRNDGMKAYLKMKDIYKECPSFRLLDKNLLPAEWAEDRFNQLFSRYLIPIVDNLMETADKETCIEACSLLSSMPPTLAKLKAYTYLSRILFGQKKYEESLRTAKLGVELLGSGHSFNHKEEQSRLWAECWTRVATCNRLKKEYDFAMSLYEKGALNGIPDCIHFLGEMYEKGESEDPDPKQAEELYKRALALSNQFERENRYEREKNEQERKAEMERIHAESERIEREEVLNSIISKNKKAKERLQYSIAILTAYIMVAILFLSTDNIKDKIHNYEKQGFTVLTYDDNSSSKCIICLDGQHVYMDDMNTFYPFLDIGKPNPAAYIALTLSNDSIRARVINGSPLIINSYKDFIIRRLTCENVFLISKSFEDESVVKDGYLLKIEQGEPKLIHIKDAVLYPDYVSMDINGDITDFFSKDLKKSFSYTALKQMKDNGISWFSTNCKLYFDDLVPSSIGEKVYFKKLMRSYKVNEIGTRNMMTEYIADAKILLNDGLTPNIISSIFNVSYTLESHRSSDGKSTFVIKKDGNDKHDTLGLFMVNNDKRTYQCLDHGMEISFEPNLINIKKYGRVLLIISANSNVHYDYLGNKVL